MRVGVYLKSSSNSKLTVSTTFVLGTSFPLPFVLFHFESKDPARTVFTLVGYVGSSQHKGTVVFRNRDWIASPVACDSIFEPSIFEMMLIVVDFPDPGTLMAVGAGQAS